MVMKLANELSVLPVEDPYRKATAALLLNKLYDQGLLSVRRDLRQCSAVTESAFCRYVSGGWGPHYQRRAS
jgi:hypothetical protein